MSGCKGGGGGGGINPPSLSATAERICASCKKAVRTDIIHKKKIKIDRKNSREISKIKVKKERNKEIKRMDKDIKKESNK